MFPAGAFWPREQSSTQDQITEKGHHHRGCRGHDGFPPRVMQEVASVGVVEP